MSRVFAYCRVSTTEQTIENQVLAIRKAGYDVDDKFVISETVSGSVLAMEREQFKILIEHKLYEGDTLICLKTDRLGRDMIDVLQTIDFLMDKKVKVICLDLPTNDLTSAEGRLVLQMFSMFAEFERNRIRERTREGLARAEAEGKVLGRKVATKTSVAVQELKQKGLTQVQVAKELGISERTVIRHWHREYTQCSACKKQIDSKAKICARCEKKALEEKAKRGKQLDIAEHIENSNN